MKRRLSLLGLTILAGVAACDSDGAPRSDSLLSPAVVDPRAALRLDSVRPSVVVDGRRAKVYGSGLEGALVHVDGFPATVLRQQSSELEIRVPYTGCRPPRTSNMMVQVEAVSDTISVGVSPAYTEDMALDVHFWRYSYAGDGCLLLPGHRAGAEYLVGVTSVSEDPNALAGFRVRAHPGDSGITATKPPLAASRSPTMEFEVPRAVSSEAADLPPGDYLLPDRAQPDQAEFLEDGLEFLRDLGPLPATVPLASSSIDYSVGDPIAFYASQTYTCTDRDAILGTVRHVGDHAVWVEDNLNPAGTFTAEDFATLDATYTDHIKGVHDTYFGAPTDIDGNGKILIVMSRYVNEANVTGYVWGLDLYPRSMCPASNEGEVFFGVVPDPDGRFGRPWSKDDVMDLYPSLIAHEVTHIIQFGNQQSLKTPWELEGGATFSERLASYSVFDYESEDMGLSELIESRDWQTWSLDMARFFGGSEYAPYGCTWTARGAGACPRRNVYGMPSLLLEYVMHTWGGDFPGGEGALMRRVTESPYRGMRSLQEVSGATSAKILAGFYLSLWVDGMPTGSSEYKMPSFPHWDLWEIRAAYGYDHSIPVVTDTNFLTLGTVRSASIFYFYWRPTGSLDPTALKMEGFGHHRDLVMWAMRLK